MKPGLRQVDLTYGAGRREHLPAPYAM